MYTEERAKAASAAYFNGEELPASTFVSKYALRNDNDVLVEDNPDSMHWRLAREFARVDSKKFRRPFSAEFIYERFRHFGKIIPQGSPMYGVGNPRAVSTSNCFVLSSPVDSYGGICRTDQELVQVSKRRGGVGIDISNIRPEGMITANSSRLAAGVVPFMERYSNSIREVGQAGRRGALMLTISVHHPQVLDFARAKEDLQKVTGANISIRLTDEFMHAVHVDGEYQQRWPIEGKPKMVRMVSARQVWQEIIRMAWKTAEPGLLFWDNILRNSPADCYADSGFRSETVNPCAELVICIHDSCRLLLLNTFAFVLNPFTSSAKFDWDSWKDECWVAQRLMDDLVDLELEKINQIISKIDSDPEPADVKAEEKRLWTEIKKKCELGRRTGTGQTSLGDAIAALGMRYDSDEALSFADNLYRELKLSCYRSSVDMARELGAFPVFDHEREKDNEFLLRIKDDDRALWENMKKYGRRNIALLTTAPAGSVSIMAGPAPYFGSTSGIEPLFKEFFIRRKRINHGETGAKVDFIDAKGDKWQEFTVYHPKLKMWMEITGEKDIAKSPYHGCCAEDIDWRQRVRLQAKITSHLCHSVSSTVNLPEDVSRETVSGIYEEAWRSGCKGMTVYRKNCRSGVLIDAALTGPTKITKNNAPKRPQDLPCDIHRLTVKGEVYHVAVGLLGGDVYEVMAAKVDLPGKVQEGFLRKVKRGCYSLHGLNGECLWENFSGAETPEEGGLTRMTSVALRHGADIAFVVDSLSKTKGDFTSFAKALARTLKKYVKDGTSVTGATCPDCGSSELVYEEGCVKCSPCGWSKCS